MTFCMLYCSPNKNVNLKYDQSNEKHVKIAEISKRIHEAAKAGVNYALLEAELSEAVFSMFTET